MEQEDFYTDNLDSNEISDICDVYCDYEDECYIYDDRDDDDYILEHQSQFIPLINEIQESVKIRKNVRLVRSSNKIIEETTHIIKKITAIENVNYFKIYAANSLHKSKKLCENLLIVSNSITHNFILFYKQKINPSKKAFMSVYQAREKLLLTLISSDSVFMSTQYSNSLPNNNNNYLDKFCVDILCFQVYLQCTAFNNLNSNIKKKISTVTIKDFPSLIKISAIPLRYIKSNACILNFTAFDISTCLGHLEFMWSQIIFSSEIFDYIELLVSVVAKLYILPQSKEKFGHITDYYIELNTNNNNNNNNNNNKKETNCIMSDKLIEDICWSVTPMYKRIIIRNKIYKHYNIAEYTIEKQQVKQLYNFFIENSKSMLNKQLTEHFRSIYIPMTLRPSEKNRYARDYKGKAFISTDIARKMRRKEYMKTLMENFDCAPWTIMTEKRFDKASRDVLLMLMIDSYVSNKLRFEWMDKFVDFNIYVVKQGLNYIDSIDKQYPKIIQDFNFFNVVHNDNIYIHNSATASFLHWIKIIMSEPYNGKIGALDVSSLKNDLDHIIKDN